MQISSKLCRSSLPGQPGSGYREAATGGAKPAAGALRKQLLPKRGFGPNPRVDLQHSRRRPVYPALVFMLRPSSSDIQQGACFLSKKTRTSGRHDMPLRHPGSVSDVFPLTSYPGWTAASAVITLHTASRLDPVRKHVMTIRATMDGGRRWTA